MLPSNVIEPATEALTAASGSSGAKTFRVNRRLDSVDALRALAAMGVVVTHIPHHQSVESNLTRILKLPLDFGSLGVTCFLVISGFCIHLAASARPGGVLVAPGWARFWKRRTYRLYPAYAVAAALSYAVYHWVGPGAYPEINRVHWLGYDAATHVLMVHNLFQHFPFSLGNGVFWTLGLEEQLYALYAVYVVLRRRMSATRLAAVVLVVSLLWRFLVVVPCGTESLGPPPLSLGSWWTWPFGWWFCWIVGAIAAEAHVGAIRLPRWCSSLPLAAAIGITALAISQLTLGQVGYSHFIDRALGHSAVWWLVFQLVPQCSVLAFSVAVFMALNYLVRAEGENRLGRLWQHLASTGRMSYSLYLTHVPVIIIVEAAVLRGASALVSYAVLVPVCLAFGWLYFIGLERHFLGKKGANHAPVPTAP